MASPHSPELPSQPPLSSSSAVNASADGLPACCTDEFRRLYRSGEVPRFGCYDPVYLRHSSRPADGATRQSPFSSSSFFPPFSALVRQYATERDAPASASASATAGEAGGEEEGEDALEKLADVRFGGARPEHSWEHITRAEDLWNGPPLTTKIPPAADYERILLDQA